MAAKAWGGAAQQKSVEEVFFQNDAVSLCMMIHRRAKTMRVIDFRAGPSQAKRMFVLSMAQREGVEKVYTLVERDEVSTWVKLGFAREGNIPGFYKRSDAFLLGCNVDTASRRQSEMRIAVREAVGVMAQDDESEAVEEEVPVDARALEFAERTIVHAKKAAKALVGKALPNIKINDIGEAEAKKQVAAALKANRALTAFEPFGRDVERRYFLMTGRGGYELVMSTESQACFGNSFLEMLTPPKTDNERLAVIASLRAMCDKMLAEGAVSCFALAPSDDVSLATAFAYNGFRRTGLLQNHLQVGTQRKDAIIWSRRLANPTDVA
ncbi:MAG TPA: hypothetical protein VLM85_32930 [Polyangiaceae bacterium]|nr:hypothetical protein [Polyangiaceae bacterium]